jgi:hypothetical protein
VWRSLPHQLHSLLAGTLSTTATALLACAGLVARGALGMGHWALEGGWAAGGGRGRLGALGKCKCKGKGKTMLLEALACPPHRGWVRGRGAAGRGRAAAGGLPSVPVRAGTPANDLVLVGLPCGCAGSRRDRVVSWHDGGQVVIMHAARTLAVRRRAAPAGLRAASPSCRPSSMGSMEGSHSGITYKRLA